MAKNRAKLAIPLARGVFTVGFWTLSSRVLGFIRDVVFAALLGAGPVAEAFFIAFSLPNVFRRFFAEGAFNTAFVPMFAKKLETNDDALNFARDSVSALAAILIAVTLLAQLAMPILVFAMASGFVGDSRFDIAVHYGRIAFPYVIFISLAALFSGVLNATGRFAAAAAAPALLNISFVLTLSAAGLAGLDPGLTLAWTVPFAGIAQLALVWTAAKRAGFRIALRIPRLTPDLRRLAIIAAPAALAGGVVQINLVIGRQVASVFEGAVAWLSYADRLYQLPLGVVGIAVGVVLLPDLSRRLSTDDLSGSRQAYNRAAEMALALSVPAAVALAVIPLPIISILFERGEFTAQDAAATSVALAIYAAGLPAFVMQKVVQPIFFARHDTKTPFLCAVAAMIINAAVAIGLINTLGYLAAALGATIAGWAMLILLWHRTRSLGDSARFDSRMLVNLPKIIFASILMGIFLWLAVDQTSDLFLNTRLKVVWLFGLVFGGLISYGTVLMMLNALIPSEVRSMIKKR